jgi:hypothetical protein
VCNPRDTWKDGPQLGEIDTLHFSAMLPEAAVTVTQACTGRPLNRIDLLASRGNNTRQALLQVWLN